MRSAGTVHKPAVGVDLIPTRQPDLAHAGSWENEKLKGQIGPGRRGRRPYSIECGRDLGMRQGTMVQAIQPVTWYRRIDSDSGRIVPPIPLGDAPSHDARNSLLHPSRRLALRVPAG